MNTIRILIVTLLLALLPSCVMAPDPIPAPGGQPVLSITLVGEAESTGVVVQFEPTVDDFTHVVQEIELDSGSVLVECFRCGGVITDRHRWASRPHWRVMTVYLANVEGADEAHGFAHLPHNGNGLRTTVGKDFNSWYQADYETRGSITGRHPANVHWSITDDGENVTITGADRD